MESRYVPRLVGYREGKRVELRRKSSTSCEALIHAFVSSRLAYCNSLLHGINKFLSFAPLLAWFSVRGNSIWFLQKFTTSCIGSLWGRGSNSRFVQRCTNVYTKELHLISLRWCCQSQIHQSCDVCDLQQGATWSSPAQKHFRANVVEHSTGQHQKLQFVWIIWKTIKNVYFSS